ncbi:MAG: RNA polymerase sigma factor [Chloroflexota bacterium]
MCADCPTRLARDLDSAFPEFLAHHQDLVYGVALRMTKRPADAEDLAQDTFIRAYRALQGYDAERTGALRTRGWLASIVANLGRNRARRKLPATAGLDVAPEVAAESRSQPEQVALRREEARAWESRLDALPPRYGRAVELRHVQGLSYPELAEALGKPLGTVKSDVHRGIRLLRRSLGHQDAADEGRELSA